MLPKKVLRQKLRNNMTPQEILLWKYLKRKQLGVKFRRQYSIGKYIADFYSSELKLVIEVDGNQHYSKDGLIYDKIREDFMSSLGIKTIRFTNVEVTSNIYGVIEKLESIIKENI